MGNDNYNPNWITLLIDNYFEHLLFMLIYLQIDPRICNLT